MRRGFDVDELGRTRDFYTAWQMPRLSVENSRFLAQLFRRVSPADPRVFHT
jgi:hypothetical protein